MTKFVYFSRLDVARFDPYYRTKKCRHSDWFTIALPGCSHINSRVTKLNTPWDQVDSLFPIPSIVKTDNFSQTIETVADQFCKHVESLSLAPYLYWSGGIDSTAILVSLLKVASNDFLDRLTILHDKSSIEENVHFYYRYIDQKLKTKEISDFKITEHNYNQIIVVDGEGGNQCVGGHSIYRMCHAKQFDLLDQPWNSVNFDSGMLNVSEFNLKLIKDSIEFAPVGIDTLYDFIWWSNFNFKFDDAMIRKMLAYGKHLSTTQRQQFWNSGLYRFFSQPEMQSWSLTNLTQLRETVRLDPKYIAKKYIYDFDHNSLWFAYKNEQGSVPEMFDLQMLPVIGFAPDWSTISIADINVRQQLRQMLF